MSPFRPVPIVDRLIALSHDDETTGCRLWHSKKQRAGYGNVYYAGGTRLAHRVSYETFVGPIPAGFQIDHLCGRPSCIRPAHLEAVTRMENIRRRFAAQTHCKRGHELSGDNLWLAFHKRDGRHYRVCRECKLASWRASYHAKKAAS